MIIATLERQAVKAAMENHWKKAVQINQKILKQEKNNIAALNRLGRAFWETGNLKKAEETYKKVLKTDRYNSIATRNLKRLTDSRQKAGKKPAKRKKEVSRGTFLEEPGKTRTVKLVRLADPKILSEFDSGDLVNLEPKKRTISVLAEDKTYLGSLPEDLSQRLIRFIKGGNQYEALIKAVDRQHLEILIRETFFYSRRSQLYSLSIAGSDSQGKTQDEPYWRRRN
jgi:tetratricopeptide (TPR) repeat protein